ncbi:MAG: hypothetical protein RIS29_490 [Bacteroidota bacterium]|jgi:hypothetical protein
MFTEIVSAEYLGGYKLSVLFNDGVKKEVDFYGILFENDYPVFRQLKDIEKFIQFKVTDTLEWDNGNIDIAPETVYEFGKIIN